MNTQLLPAASLPVGPRAEPRDGGVSWDAVRMPAYLGDRVLAALRMRTGGVIRDPYQHRLYFFVTPCAADEWRFPEDAHVRILGAGSCVVFPPSYCDRAADVYWTRPVVNGRLLTGSRRLHAAMQGVIGQAVPQ